MFQDLKHIIFLTISFAGANKTQNVYGSRHQCSKGHHFLFQLNQFVIFEKNLVILTHVAAMLPDSACETDQHDVTTMDPLAGNSTDVRHIFDTLSSKYSYN